MDPSVGVFIPITAIVAWSAVKIASISARNRSGSPETTQRLAALEQDLGTLRQELSETQERLDFAERLLSQQQAPDRLERGR
jgi:hypothetical protein